MSGGSMNCLYLMVQDARVPPDGRDAELDLRAGILVEVAVASGDKAVDACAYEDGCPHI
jgi:hypothetical protein